MPGSAHQGVGKGESLSLSDLKPDPSPPSQMVSCLPVAASGSLGLGVTESDSDCPWPKASGDSSHLHLTPSFQSGVACMRVELDKLLPNCLFSRVSSPPAEPAASNAGCSSVAVVGGRWWTT